MRISDILSICFKNLTRRGVRTALTVTGVVIGVCAIILMVSIGIGAKQSMEEMLKQWGDLTVIQVYNYNSQVKLDDTAVASMQAMDGVDIATPFYQVNDFPIGIKTKNGRYDAYLTLIGVYPGALEKLGYEVTDGKFFSVTDKEYSILVGANFAYNFRDTKKKNNNYVDRGATDANGNPKPPFVDVMKDKMLIYMTAQKEGVKDLQITPNVVGVLKEDWSKGWETSECVFINLNELKSLVAQYKKANGIKDTKGSAGFAYQDVRVKCTSIDKVAAVQQAIKDMGYECSSMEDTREMFNKQLSQVQGLLGGLAAISLFVAAIGIANTMVMSIYERTHEIGVMKVIGAQIGDIRRMFLTESAMIGLLGGLVGVALSFLISYLLNNVAAVSALLQSIGLSFGDVGGKVSVIPAWLVLVAMAFSMAIGIIFGFIPANRAVKISALEAIKHD